MMYTFIAGACPDLPVRVCCRVMGVSPSGFYQRRNQPVTNTKLDDAYLANTICDNHKMSRRSYSAQGGVHAELRLGMGVRCNRKRVERIMHECSIQGIHRRRKGGTTRRDPNAESSDDLVNRDFDPDGPDRL